MPQHKYRGYIIYHDPPPIPIRSFDWTWAHEDYDGPGDPRSGNAATLAEAMAAIDEREDDGA